MASSPYCGERATASVGENHQHFRNIRRPAVERPRIWGYDSCRFIPAIASDEVQFFVSYYAAKLRNALTYHFPYKAIPLHPNRVVFIEKGKVSEEMECHKEEMELLKKYLFDNAQPLRKEDLQTIRTALSGRKSLYVFLSS
ncbi:MAG: hypothetical protein U5L09_18890 [Bacteroidales bacterium]|nr:hypothetical protein [Bacteroidales bacterium]